jgi:hypothetical protein
VRACSDILKVEIQEKDVSFYTKVFSVLFDVRQNIWVGTDQT